MIVYKQPADVRIHSAYAIAPRQEDRGVLCAFTGTPSALASGSSCEWHSELETNSNEDLSIEPVEAFDWADKKTLSEYICLEQHVSAQIASPEQRERYLKMKRSRNEMIFADRVLRDYAEIERLRTLSAKLDEVCALIRPIPVK